ncbi:Na/Pi cotransporter family protein [Psychromonas ossibalaenae]|uniref:Na/Pi cotransporter family protein n=1 Tax=Psychromonas ossibalaenae TaxID=444922 RepID=UPI00037AACAB|nr:Na/Pi symporter [Psychromonas ossibalaenae]
MNVSLLFENVDSIMRALGGLGLFLLGLIIMMDALRALAGDAVRTAIVRFTHSPLSGAITGAVATAVLRSSSATTVAAVGFVGAGLIGFSESLGIIFGANVGTTLTGWIVVLLGFKLNLEALMTMLLLIGALLRLLAKNTLATSGYALAGFSLMFVGIAMMQQGMSGFGDIITPEQLPPDTFTGRLKLVAIGIIFTLFTQSSSAGVAMALAALFSGSINFPQAAALVIGMDVGTTVTAVMATIGQSREARRTGFSHVFYNIIAAVFALLFITPFTMLLTTYFPSALENNAEISLVAFHSAFNILALLIILPFTKQFASLMIKLIPEQSSLFNKPLDKTLLKEPNMALTAVQNSVHTEATALLTHINAMLGDHNSRKTDILQLQLALDKTHAYIDLISLKNESGAQWERLVAMIHMLDHMQRLHERCEEEEDRAITLRDTQQFVNEKDIMILGIKSMMEAMEANNLKAMLEHADITREQLHKQLKPYRTMIVEQIARGELDIIIGTDYLEGIRWLKRVSWHLIRISFHYKQAILAAGK